MKIREVTIADVLSARDARVERQNRLLRTHHVPLISFTMNVAGPVKMDSRIARAFNEGMRRINAVLKGRRVRVLAVESLCEFTGGECIWAVDANAESLKTWMQLLEEEDALGRLFDIDVIDCSGAKLSRSSERRCLICDRPVRACARSRAHSVDELFTKTHEIIESFFRSRFHEQIALLAEKSLLYEVMTTPKPGLVDLENSGAHTDMDRFTFVDSACILRAYFRKCTEIGAENPGSDDVFLFERLRSAGQQAEMEMLEITGGVNTHKGALFSLGILCCAAGCLRDRPFTADELFARAASLAKSSLKDFERSPDAPSSGEQQFSMHGLTGVRGEAANGFPAVRNFALPAFEKALLSGKSINDAGLSALLALMANVSDSNLIRRGGEAGLKAAQNEARSTTDPDHAALRRMNDRFIRDNLSPGGCADLLAITYFIHFLKTEWTGD